MRQACFVIAIFSGVLIFYLFSVHVQSLSELPFLRVPSVEEESQLQPFQTLDVDQEIDPVLQDDENPILQSVTAPSKFVLELTLQALKEKLLEQVWGQHFSELMQKAIAESGRAKPLKIIIATTWRSGSTFLEELLASHPAVHNYYEPLTHLALQRARSGPEATEAQRMIMDLLHCRYEKVPKYMTTAHRIKEMLSRSSLLWSICNGASIGATLCFNADFLHKACEFFPWAVMKLVRLRLALLEPVLMDKTLNAHVIYLVRDPRGVMNSRTSTVKWCNKSDCSSPKVLCGDMENDFEAAMRFRTKFPNRIHFLRFEDMAVNPLETTKSLLSKIGLDFDPVMQDYIKTHTTKNVDQPWTTSRESSTRVLYWSTKLSPDKLREIQGPCEAIMKTVGYKTVSELRRNITLNDVLMQFTYPNL